MSERQPKTKSILSVRSPDTIYVYSSSRAATGNSSTQWRYKAKLHRAIWFNNFSGTALYKNRCYQSIPVMNISCSQPKSRHRPRIYLNLLTPGTRRERLSVGEVSVKGGRCHWR
ncbi:hypothetical protein RRG08_054266 [Elysia crispata]|uniref:Uncharacterized protein n=1 Tax=Elysia crispata TaxID=231223 RepID=A0AAE0YCX7_9GAST|nr:hypothetical protein RRG08_054266 [Elysia crispata]